MTPGELVDADPVLARRIGQALRDVALRTRKDYGRVPPEVEAFIEACLAGRNVPPVAGDDGNQPADASADSDLLDVGEVARLLGCTRQHA